MFNKHVGYEKSTLTKQKYVKDKLAMLTALTLTLFFLSLLHAKFCYGAGYVYLRIDRIRKFDIKFHVEKLNNV